MSFGDTLYAVGQWLRSTQLTELSLAAQNTGLAKAVTENFWAVPTIQTIHILAIAMVFGSVLMINLRILQLAGSSRTMTATVRRYLPWVWWGLLVLLISGAALIFSDPVRNLTNAVFWLKMILVLTATAISLWFQGSVRRNVAHWEESHQGRVLVRIGAVLVIILFCAIMFAGRWIAYAPS